MQPAVDTYHVSRRSMDVEDYLDVLRRHKSWIVGPLFAGLVIATVVAFMWPDQYVSEAQIRVLPSTIPPQFVPNAVNSTMTDRIQNLAQSALSRDNLGALIETWKLYPKERGKMPMDDVIEKMRGKIRIGSVVAMATNGSGQASGAFKITYQYENRQLAQKVVEQLSGKFIDDNTRRRSTEAGTTSKFLQDDAGQAKRELDEAESKLSSYKMANNGRLPDQMSGNFQQIAGLQASSSNLQAALSRANQDKLIMEGALRTATMQRNSIAPPAEPTAEAVRNDKLLSIDREISQVELALAGLKERYTPTHPDVQRAESALKSLQRQRETIAKSEQSRKADAVAVSPAAKAAYDREVRAAEAEISRLQLLLKAKESEISETSRELKRLDGEVSAARSRLMGIPAGEQQLADLMMARNLAAQRYTDSKKRSEMGELGRRVEVAAMSETLEQLDRASLPGTPTEPKRPTIIGAGAALGFVCGLLIAGIREVKDTSLKNLKDVRAYTQLNVLGSVPLLENDVIVRRRRRMAMLGWATASLAGCVIMVGSVWYYYATHL